MALSDNEFVPKPGDVFRTAQRQITVLRVLDRWLILQVSAGDRTYVDHVRTCVWLCHMPRRKEVWKNGKNISPRRNA